MRDRGDWGSVPRELNEVGRLIDACLVHGLATAEGLHEVIGLPTATAPDVTVSIVIPAYNAFNLPPLDVMKELTTRKAYLAHEELI